MDQSPDRISLSRHTLLAACLGSALGGMLLFSGLTSLGAVVGERATMGIPPEAVLPMPADHGCPYLRRLNQMNAAHFAAGVYPIVPVAEPLGDALDDVPPCLHGEPDEE